MAGQLKRPARRPVKPKALSRQFAQAVIDHANDSVTYVRLSGTCSRMSRFEAVVIQLASGQAKDCKANVEFINLVRGAALRLEELDLAEIADDRIAREVDSHAFGSDFAARFPRFLQALQQV